jgi:hypothetical protein
MGAEAYLTVTIILAGFGVTVLMFRIQREPHVRESNLESIVATAVFLGVTL